MVGEVLIHVGGGAWFLCLTAVVSVWSFAIAGLPSAKKIWRTAIPVHIFRSIPGNGMGLTSKYRSLFIGQLSAHAAELSE